MSKIEFSPLGGVGEIGANSMLVKGERSTILIDSGLLFPDNDSFGIDYLCPDFSRLKGTGCDLLILTHAHEDHLGATKDLLEIFPDIPIWGPPLAGYVLQKKYPGLKFNFKAVDFSKEYELGEFKICFIQVNHSIPQTSGIHIGWGDLYSFFYVSDFKIDFSGLNEPAFNFSNLKKLSQDKKYRVLFPDSTNILRKGKTPLESEVLYNLEKYIRAHQHRTIITQFSSNIYRLFGIFKIAQDLQRNVYLIGRSSVEFYKIGLRMGLKTEANVILDSENYHDPNAIFILSGCQGDYRGALRRYVDHEIKGLYPNSSDLILFSAMAIPGNESKVWRIINKLVEEQCTVITNSDSLIHASGHPCQEDLTELYQSYNPHYSIPIHGESYFIQKHFEFILEKFPTVTPIKIFNGHSIIFGKAGDINAYPANSFSYKFIHEGGMPIDSSALSQRRKLASSGVIFLTFKSTGKKEVIGLEQMGISHWIDNHKKDILYEIESFLYSTPYSRAKEKSEETRIFVRNLYKKYLGYTPIVMVIEIR